MEMIYKAYNTDPDISALYAESIMNIAPWKLWEQTA